MRLLYFWAPSPYFSPSLRPASSCGESDAGVGREKAYRDIRLSGPPPQAAVARRPFGPVENADRVRRTACPMHEHRAAPLSCPVGILNRRRTQGG